MPKTIERDHKLFRDTVAGKILKKLQKDISTSSFLPRRGKNGKLRVTIPSINQHHIVYGKNENGVGRGEGNPNDVLDNDAKGNKGAGDGAAEGIMVEIDLDEFLLALGEEWQLPEMKPKNNKKFDEIEIKYTNIAKTGPESLRHNRRTMTEALKRQLSSGIANQLVSAPGQAHPVQVITPIRNDFRYRQWKEFRKPTSQAVIMFARDGSASMDAEKCDIVSDMAWWMEAWIKRFYDKVDTCYFWHDSVAQELDKDKFYKQRYGGGTKTSPCFKLMAKQLENRFLPETYNIYCFYFTDGDNWGDDNSLCYDYVAKYFPPDICNLFAITQVMPDDYDNSLMEFFDDKQRGKKPTNISTAMIGDVMGGSLTEDKRNEEIKRAIQKHLGKRKV